MHGAPSVSYPVGRSRLGGLLLLACWLAGLAALALWAWQVPMPGWRHLLGFAASLLAGLLAWQMWLHMPAGQLSWDGQAWSWSEAQGAPAGQVQVSLDLQHLLLLRWQGGGQVHWLCPQRQAHPALWADLRRAVYSRARPQAPDGGETPTANP